MKYIDLRKKGREGLREIRRQVVRLKEMGKTGKEIEELLLQHVKIGKGRMAEEIFDIS